MTVDEVAIPINELLYGWTGNDIKNLIDQRNENHDQQCDRELNDSLLAEFRDHAENCRDGVYESSLGRDIDDCIGEFVETLVEDEGA